jgi:hypothetical protein
MAPTASIEPEGAFYGQNGCDICRTLQKQGNKPRFWQKLPQKVNIKFAEIAKMNDWTLDKRCFIVYNDTIQTP